MTNSRTPRSRWVDEGLRALASGGPEAVRVETMAQALGVSKGGFYWHFDGRPALLVELLAEWERLVIDQVIDYVEAGGGDARDKLRRLFAVAARDVDVLRVEAAIRDWARRDNDVARRLKRIDNRRMDYMRGLFGAFCDDDDEVEVRCMTVMSLFAGAHLVAADHRGRKRADVLARALERLQH